MNNDEDKKQDSQPQPSEEREQVAVPYVPPPPPDESSVKRFRSPLVNGMLAALVILLVGFMAYHFIGHQLTQVAGVSQVRNVTSAPSNSPSISPTPHVSISPSQ